jgi:hypothetical protein
MSEFGAPGLSKKGPADPSLKISPSTLSGHTLTQSIICPLRIIWAFLQNLIHHILKCPRILRGPKSTVKKHNAVCSFSNLTALDERPQVGRVA